MKLSLSLLVPALAAGSITPLCSAAELLSAEQTKRADNQTCKCYPEDACWPAESRWKALNQAVQGRLSSVTPAAAACYPTFGNVSTASAAKCDAVRGNWTNANWIVDQPVQTFSTFWSNNSCDATAASSSPANATSGCSASCTLGLSPQMVVMAKNTFDVQVSVNFARVSNLRLVVRNTGHDAAGRSTGYGALAVNTHNLNNLQFMKSYTGPSATNYTGGAVKVSAGVMFRDLYPAAKAQGVDVVGADSLTVGAAGGYILGGGHSPLSGLYGLAADNVLGFDVILASGSQVQVNSDSNPDLFWALKGGGPSNYAAVLAVTVKTFPTVPCTGASLNMSYAQPNFWKGFAAFHSYANTLVDAGMYVSYSLTKAGGLAVQPFVGPNMTVAEFNRTIQPLLTQLTALNLTYTLSPPTTYPTFADLYAAPGLFPATHDAGGRSTLMGNRLLSKNDTAQNGPAIAAAVQGIVEGGHVLSGRMVNPGRAVPDPGAELSAAHPVWRAAADSVSWIYSVPGSACGGGLSEAARQAAVAEVTHGLADALRKASPQSASYVNEGNADEPNWQDAFWGSNYKKLAGVKAKYDPNGVFWAQSTPGSEAWALVDETRLCKAS